MHKVLEDPSPVLPGWEHPSYVPAPKRRNKRKGYPTMPCAAKRSPDSEESSLSTWGLSVAMVAKLVPTKVVNNTPKARAANDKEWDNLAGRDCWDTREAKLWRKVKPDKTERSA